MSFMQIEANRGSYSILVNHVLEVPWNWVSNSVERLIDIVWKPEETRILSARLRWLASTTAWFPVAMYIYFNREQVWSGPVEDGEQDVTGLLTRGVNEFKLVTSKLMWHLFSYSVTVSAYLILEWEGEPPDVRAVREPTKPFPWKEYTEAGLIGVLIGGGAGLMISLIWSPEQPPKEHMKRAVLGSVAGAALCIGVRYLITPP